MKRIIYSRIDGGVSIVTPAINIDEDIDEEQALSRAVAQLPKDAIDARIVAENVIPTDRTFRNAWEKTDNSIIQNMEKCRELTRENIRIWRKPLLEKLDVDYMRADEARDEAAKAAIASEKQMLRDMTADPGIDAAQSPEELKRFLK